MSDPDIKYDGTPEDLYRFLAWVRANFPPVARNKPSALFGMR